MQGNRKVLTADDTSLDVGDYGFNPIDGKWHCVTPDGHYGNLGGHDVTEHEDGTITVSPSILVTDWKGGQWHGYLERGVWREV